MVEFGKSVLLLGSFEGQLSSICRAFESSGFEARLADSLSEALRAQKQQPSSVVVCDLKTFADCLYAIRALRRVEPGSKIILLAPTSGWRWLDMIECGAYDVLATPCQVNDLVWTVNSALRAGNPYLVAKAV